jgi:tetratricopeptide (TPR) repeat protein
MTSFCAPRSLALLALAIVLPPILTCCSRENAPSSAKLDEPDKIIAEYTEAIRRNPNDANAYYQRGVRYQEMGEAEKAIIDFTEAIRLKDPRANYNRAAAYKKKKEYDKAIADYSAVIALNSKSSSDPGDALLRAGLAAKAYFGRGACYDAKGEPEQAIADYKEAVRRDPNLLSDDLKKRIK